MQQEAMPHRWVWGTGKDQEWGVIGDEDVCDGGARCGSWLLALGDEATVVVCLCLHGVSGYAYVVPPSAGAPLPPAYLPTCPCRWLPVKPLLPRGPVQQFP